MNAILIDRFGGPEELHPAVIPRPALRPGHVLIEVGASSVNPVDFKIRAYGPPIAPTLPAVLHGDVAGTIIEVEDGVATFRPGDEVYACAGGVKGLGGALADYMLADADLVALKPRTLTMAQAATLPLVSLTAWEGLFDRARLQAGQTVLVYGGTGGVGSVAIQLARWAGATVFATASSPEKAAIARQLGATETIDYARQSVADYVRQYTDGKGFDVVFDTVGDANLPHALAAAATSGTVICITQKGEYNLSEMHAKGLSLHFVFMLLPMLTGAGRAHQGNTLRQVAKLVEEGNLRPLVHEQTFSFAEVGAAHRLLEQGQAIGKIALVR